MDQDKVRINLWISKPMYAFMETLSSIDGRSMSDVVREAMRDYMEQHQDRVQKEKADG
jgi:Arc/MetJ-type ribon-helix-helix transcriptional regulator